MRNGKGEIFMRSKNVQILLFFFHIIAQHFLLCTATSPDVSEVPTAVDGANGAAVPPVPFAAFSSPKFCCWAL